MLAWKEGTPLYEKFTEHQRTHIGKTGTEKNVGRTLFCPRIWSTSEYSCILDNENARSLLFRGDILLRVSGNVSHHVLDLLSSHSINLICQILFTQVSQLSETSYWS